MIEIGGKPVKLITPTFFFPIEGVEEFALRHFDGVSLSRAGEWRQRHIERWREKNKSVLFHSGLGISLEPDETYLTRLERELDYVEQMEITDFSLALGFTCSQVERTKYGYQVPVVGAQAYSFDEFLQNCSKNAEFIRARLPSARISVENLDYCRGGAYECCQPGQIRQALEAMEGLGIDLLLDFGHAEVSAYKNLGNLLSDFGHSYYEKKVNYPGGVISPDYILNLVTDKYLSALPLEKVRWVHLHRAVLCEEEIFDGHALFGPQEVAWLIKAPNLEFVTIETPHNVLALLQRAVDLLKFFVL